MALHWLGCVQSQASRNRVRRLPTLAAHRPGPPPRLEELEGRLAPASLITIIPDESPLYGSLDAVFVQRHGTITVNDGSVRGFAPETLSRRALESVAKDYDISITARNGIDFGYAQAGLPRLGTIHLQTATGHNVRFAVAPTGKGGIRFQDPTTRIETQGGNLIFATPGPLTVGQLSIDTRGGTLTFNTSGPVTVGDLSTTAGSLDLAARDLTITGKLSGPSTILLRTNVLTMTEKASIDAGTNGTVTIQPFDPGRAIDLGTRTANTLSVIDADLAKLTAAFVQIGSPSSGNLTVTAGIHATQFQKLTLRTGGAILQGVNGLLQAQILSLAAGTGIGSTGALATLVNELAGATTTAGNIQLNNRANLTVSGPVQASSLRIIQLTADGDLTVEAPVQTTNGSIRVQAGGAILQGAGGLLRATTLTLAAGTGIGSTGALQTQVTQLAGATTSGNIQLNNSANLTISGPVQTSNGSIGVQTIGTGTNLILANNSLVDASLGGVTLVTPGLLTMYPLAVVTAAGGVVTFSLGPSTTTTWSTLRGQVTGDAVQVTSIGNLWIAGAIQATTGNVSVQTTGNGALQRLDASSRVTAARNAFFSVGPATRGNVALLGSVSCASLIVNGGKGNDTLTIQCATRAPISVNTGQGEDTVWVNVYSTSGYTVQVNMDGSASDLLQVNDLTRGGPYVVTHPAAPFNGTVPLSYPAPGKTSTINFSGVRTVIRPQRSTVTL